MSRIARLEAALRPLANASLSFTECKSLSAGLGPMVGYVQAAMAALKPSDCLVCDDDKSIEFDGGLVVACPCCEKGKSHD